MVKFDKFYFKISDKNVTLYYITKIKIIKHISQNKHTIFALTKMFLFLGRGGFRKNK